MDNKKRESILDRVREYFSSNDIDAEVVDNAKSEDTPKEEKFETVLLVDGETEVTIEPAIEAGAAIVITAEDGTPVAAPAGEYELQDGRVLVVEEDGVIAAIQEAAETPEEEPMADDVPNNAEQVKRVIERIEKEKIFSKEEAVSELTKVVEFLKAENEALKEEMVELKKFTKETFETLLSEPSKEPVVNNKTSIKQFREEFGQDTDPLASWLKKHN